MYHCVLSSSLRQSQSSSLIVCKLETELKLSRPCRAPTSRQAASRAADPVSSTAKTAFTSAWLMSADPIVAAFLLITSRMSTPVSPWTVAFSKVSINVASPWTPSLLESRLCARSVHLYESSPLPNHKCSNALSFQRSVCFEMFSFFCVVNDMRAWSTGLDASTAALAAAAAASLAQR
jgi:hypothetical protein